MGGVAIAAVLIGGVAYVLRRPADEGERRPSRPEPAATSRPPRPPLQVAYSDPQVRSLARQLDAEAIPTRTAAAKALARMGPRAKEAMPALVEALGRPNAGIEFDTAVGHAIQSIGAAALPELLMELRSNDRQTRTCAATALGTIGPPAAGAVQGLIAALEGDPEYGVRSSAAAALGLIGPAAKAALPVLRKAAGDPNAKITDDPAGSQLRIAAGTAMKKIKAAP